MKVKTSITLSSELLKVVDTLAGPGSSRSAFIERVLCAFIKQRQREATNARELDALNRHAARLNVEVADVLEYQATWAEE